MCRALTPPAPLFSTPRGSLLACPPPTPPPLALPRPATLCRRCRGRHAAEGTRRGTATAPSICGLPCTYSLPLYRTAAPYKTPTEASLASLPFLLPHERQAERHAVRRNSSPPILFHPNSSTLKLPHRPCLPLDPP
ncbi:hypothetical protein GQ55_2G160500 [Panicum hallii var. hallii]|uniref:Uncharacterized protein n=1 Tax=Panicum hallii var. hallii TaxID=1504633 RepID=A0A2T7EPX8_9POAL|nr:hypothetical protein GQ55_2G160500 [Panicum hallii var. hallii]